MERDEAPPVREPMLSGARANMSPVAELDRPAVAAERFAEAAGSGVGGVTEQDRIGHIMDVARALAPFAEPGGPMEEDSILIQGGGAGSAHGLVLTASALYSIAVEISGDRARTAITARRLGDALATLRYEYEPTALMAEQGPGHRTSWTFRFADGDEVTVAGSARHGTVDEHDAGERFARLLAVRVGL